MIRRPCPTEIKLLPQIENEADRRYTRVGLRQIVDMPPAALASLALGPSAPREVEMENIRLENDTTLHWQANPEPGIAGYRIVWRETTAPVWQNSRDVGNATRETLVGISKDNFLFGVQAYDRDGNLSVTTFPRAYRPVGPLPAR